jgi:hypothetical protein
MEAWEVVVAATTTTTKAITTTVQTGTTLGPSGQSSSGVDVWSDVVVPLGAALVGALAALGGSVLVNRWELSRKARLDIWETILPELTGQWTKYEMNIKLGEPLPPAPPMQEPLAALRRKAVVVSRRDKRASDALSTAWRKWRMLHIEADDPKIEKEGERQPEAINKERREAEESFHQKLWDYFKYVEAKLR